jgi:hypothetical protein
MPVPRVTSPPAGVHRTERIPLARQKVVPAFNLVPLRD